MCNPSTSTNGVQNDIFDMRYDNSMKMNSDDDDDDETSFESFLSDHDEEDNSSRMQHQYQHQHDEQVIVDHSSLLLSYYTRFIVEVKVQLKTALPTLVGIVLYKIPWLISLRFVGGIGQVELAAAALASTLCNVTGLSLSVGLSSALSTLTSQSRGRIIATSTSTTTTSSSSNCLDIGCTETRNNSINHHNSDIIRDDDDIESKRLLQENGNGCKDDTVWCSSTDSLSTTNQIVHDPIPIQSSISASSITTINKHDSSASATIHSPYEYLIRGLFIQALFVLPIGIWWLYGIENILIQLGQEPTTASMTTQYLRILTPGLWAYSINWTITTWLQSLELAFIPAYAAAIGLLFHVPLNYLFVYGFNWGYLGCAVATITFQISQPLLIVGYLLFTTNGRSCLAQKTLSNTNPIGTITPSLRQYIFSGISDVRGILQYLGLAVPGIVAISEWWASEITIFLSGRLQPTPSLALGAMTLYQSINTFCYMFPVCFAVSCSTRVGTLLGAGRPYEAQFAGTVSIICAGFVSTCIGTILYCLPHTFVPSLFAPTEPELINETSKVIPLLALYVIGDGLTTAINGIIKGCGKQRITMPAVIIAYWLIAVPLAYYLAFIQNDGSMICSTTYYDPNTTDTTTTPISVCGIVALVTAMTIGTWIDLILRSAIVLFTIDWTIESQRAIERIQMKKR